MSAQLTISKANSIRFAHIDGKMASFDNTLSCNESWRFRPTKIFKHTFFKDDVVLLQVKSVPSTAVTVTKYYTDGSTTIIPVTTTTTYTGEFYIHEYVLTLSSLEEFYIVVENGKDTWQSENIQVIASDSDYMLIQWSNQDTGNNTFEFDYSTTLSETYVNFMRIKAEMFEYKPKGESNVYDNQNELTKLKENIYRQQSFKATPVPRQIAEIITIAMAHDLFLINEVGYVVEDMPEVEPFGGAFQVTALLTTTASLGLNTHDIGYSCDAEMNEVENYKQLAAGGSGSFAASDGFGVTQIIAKKVSGTPKLTIGSTVSGDEIFMEEEITDTTPPTIVNVRYTPDTSGTWTIYYNVTGGVIDLYIQTIKFEA